MTEKQTVYLPVIKHNVFCEYRILNKDGVTEHFANKEQVFVFTPEELNEYTANVIKKALKTAAEKVKTIHYTNGKDYSIDKQSITDTFDQTYKNFEV